MNVMAKPVCPAGTSHCRSDDKNCIDVGQKGPDTGWCWGGTKCSYGDGTATCVSWGESCPAGTKLCSPTDTNCIEPGGTGPVGGWCAGSSDQCYSKDGKQLLCQKMTQAYSCDTTGMKETLCPAEYSHCRPDDKNCTDIGQTNKNIGAWCTRGKQCNTTGGLTCVGWNEQCPSGSTRCSASDTNCKEPGTYFTYSDNQWPWCPDGMALYSLTEMKAYCLPLHFFNQFFECQISAIA